MGFSVNELIQREQLYHIPVNSNVWPIAANRRGVLTCPCFSEFRYECLSNSQSSAENECKIENINNLSSCRR